MERDRYRLPRTVEPSRYDLTIEPDLSAGTFVGSVDVAMTINEQISEIVLNALDLSIEIGVLTARDGRSIGVGAVSFDTELERATLTLAEAVDPGECTLHLEFRGELNDMLHGFYRSTYADDETGETHVIATTQFEAADARRAFPAGTSPIARLCSVSRSSCKKV